MKNDIKKSIAYRSGVLGAVHRIRNRGTLTVTMFHRVLPVSEARAIGADPEWTMKPESFRACLRFFKRHYNVVTPKQVFAALRGEAKLPATSLLITFDDGWRDTAEYAQPILDEFALPALIFVAGAAINQAEPFWEERVFALLSTNPGIAPALARALGQNDFAATDGMGDPAIRSAIGLLGKLGSAERQRVLDALPTLALAKPAMMDSVQLKTLADSGHTIGGHGMLHQPLTRVSDLRDELHLAQRTVAAYLGQLSIESMSFPHGASDDKVEQECRAAGYRHLFNSDARLNALPAHGMVDAPIGRIHLSECAITDVSGRFKPELLATSLFLRPTVRLEASKGNHG